MANPNPAPAPRPPHPARRAAVLALLLSLFLTPAAAQAQDLCLETFGDEGGVVGTGLADAARYPVHYVANYQTMIGPQDLRNSTGRNLGDLRAVLQQDRANVHRFGKPDRRSVTVTGADGRSYARVVEDEPDPFFGRRANRALWPDMVWLPLCDLGRPYADQTEAARTRLAAQVLSGAFAQRPLTVLVFPLQNGGYGFALTAPPG